SGDGMTFGGPTPFGTFAAVENPFEIAVGKINRDAAIDIVVTSYRSGELSVLLGNGNGTFQPAKTLSVGQHPKDVVVVDINHDGANDVIVANEADGNIAVLLGDGLGGFSTPTPPTYAVGVGARGVAAADFDEDGNIDIVVASYERADVLLGHGDGVFT